MAITNFNTSNQTFRKLMGNGLVYRVPMFQRDYSWTEQEWDDLWQDIVALTEPGGEQGHYMGYLVLQSSDERNYDIIDGQQRMTTLSLLVLAILSNLHRLVSLGVEADDNRRRVEELRKTYIGYLDPVTLIATPKLKLNRHNDQYYQTYLVPLERPPRRNLKASEHLLRKSFEWFQERVRQRFGEGRSGADLARLVDTVADRLFFTVISVTDELNAFKVFETLNARGVRLSSTDLLKNYLFSVVHGAGSHEHEMRTLEERWEAIVGKLGSEDVPDFLRVFWNSQNPLTRHSDLFKEIRNSINDKAAVFGLLRDMDRDADIYAALGDPDDALWTGDQKKHVAELAMFNVRQPYALLLAARRALADAEFTRVLRACTIVSFRYNVIGNLATNEQERVYNAVAEKIARTELAGAQEIIRALRAVYPSDEQFRAAFGEKQIRTTTSRNRQVVRYVLFEIERQVSGRAFDYTSDRYNIEHVLPEHPGEEWNHFTDEQVDRCVFRIGNMTPLAAAQNRDMGNGAYAEKRPLLERCEFEITKRLAAENETWTPERIAARQQWLASQATSIWRLSEVG
ncbi:MAG TPA: DUF262 domain-containing HNH endonuclease family protein [Verrucomicrobiota bacterium]|nr:DUF262 domain-containing HNH endonuclease family protein [Verrucomicrobiota bacterium]